MLQITEEQIAQAEAEAQDAEQARVQAERNFVAAPAAGDRQRRFNEASTTAAHAAATARQLRSEYEAQQSAQEARDAALQAARKNLPGIAKQLNASADTVVAAVKEAEAAMTKLLTAAAAHDALVRAASADLQSRGLVLDAGHEIGAARSGELRLAGEWWWPIDAPLLLASSFSGVVAENAPHHRLGRLRWASPMDSGREGRDGLGDRLPRR